MVPSEVCKVFGWYISHMGWTGFFLPKMHITAFHHNLNIESMTVPAFRLNTAGQF